VVDPMTLFVSSLGTAAGKALAGEGFRLLRELVGLQEAQLQLLRAVDLKVDALITGPFNAGRRDLESALAEGRDTADREMLLKEARSRFTLALSQDPEHLRRSLAALHLAAVWLALGSVADVRHSLQEAHIEALRAVPAERDRKVSGLRGLRLRLDEGARRSREQITEARIIPYANELARTRRAWGTTGNQAPIFVGGASALDTEEEKLQTVLALRLRFNRMVDLRQEIRPMPDDDQQTAAPSEIPDWVTDRHLYNAVYTQVLRQEILTVLDLEDWLRTYS
jgi:hypothetical protein